MTSVKFGLLGPLEVAVGSHWTALTGPQQRALLAILLINPGRPVPASDLIAELWPDRTTPVAANTLHAQVTRLRNTFIIEGRVAVQIYSRAGGYLLEAAIESIDVGQFASLRRRASEQEPARAAALLRQALGLWRGAALQDAAVGRRCRAAAAGLEEARLQTHEQLARLNIAGGDPQAAVVDLHELALLHPMRETLITTLMAGLNACGRRAEALQLFQHARARIGGALGVEPGQVMQREHLRILNGGTR